MKLPSAFSDPTAGDSHLAAATTARLGRVAGDASRDGGEFHGD